VEFSLKFVRNHAKHVLSARADAMRLVAVYPYRDADYSQITLQTKDLILVSCGVPGILMNQLKEAADRASEFVVRFCGGEVKGDE